MTHLSSRQISEWILGERDPETERHLNTCGKCHEEVAGLQNGLMEFKQSVRAWSEQPAEMRVSASRVPSRVSWRWAGVCAGAMSIMMSIIMLILYQDVQQAQREAKRAQDLLLLNQVHAHLTRTVPQPMEQLMKLMNDETGGPQ